MQMVVHTVLMLVIMVAMAGCQPRAAVSPAPPTQQAEELPAPALEKPSTRTIEEKSSAIAWPPPPPPIPPKPTADDTASIEDDAAGSGSAPPAPKTAGDTTQKIEAAATNTKSIPPAPEPTPNATALPQKPRWKNVRSAVAVPDQNTLYDEDNPGYQTLQKANQALKGFPLIKKGGELDWGEALSSGLIQPRASLSGNGEMMVLDFDIVMKDTKSTPYVRFSHKTHTQWLECSNCHRQIFIPMINANPISMAAILDGKYCGVCHNKVAFPTIDCERCHNVPKDQ